MPEEVIQKLIMRRGFFKNLLLVAKDLWWSKNTRNNIQVNKATDVHHDHHQTRGSEIAKMSQDMNKIQDARDGMVQKSFIVSPICVYCKCAVFPLCELLIIKKQTNKHFCSTKFFQIF